MSSSPPPALAAQNELSCKRLLRRAMHASDDLVISLEYVDSKGHKTRRVVSPIRFAAAGQFLALCLCRCEPRYFDIRRCSNIQLKRAEDYVMPVPIAQAG